MPDRKKVIEQLESMRDYHRSVGNNITADIANDAVDLLKEQKTETGTWILDDEDANSWECSKCGDLLLINDGTPYENGWFFCPHCGTKLEEQAVKQNEC